MCFDKFEFEFNFNFQAKTSGRPVAPRKAQPSTPARATSINFQIRYQILSVKKTKIFLIFFVRFNFAHKFEF
jgi:hypothetical protein